MILVPNLSKKNMKAGLGLTMSILMRKKYSLVIAAAKVYSMPRNIESELIIGYTSN